MKRETIESLLTGMQRHRFENVHRAWGPVSARGNRSDWLWLENLLDEALDVLNNPEEGEHYRTLLRKNRHER